MNETSTETTISVVMSVHNGEKYLREAVDSILDQTFRHFEFIIIDDGSADRSKAILEEYAAKDVRIRLVSRENHGLTKSLNEGLALARGEFIARMDGDDVSLPARFEEQVQFLMQNPEHVAVGSGVMMTDSDLRPLQQRYQPKTHSIICRELLLGNGGAMTHPAVMIRHSAIQKIGGYDERFMTAQDLDLFIRLSEIGKLENLGSVLLLWRQHAESINRTKFSTWRQVKRLALKEAINRQGVDVFINTIFPEDVPYSYSHSSVHWAKIAMEGGQLRTAWFYALHGLMHGPQRLISFELISRILFDAIHKSARLIKRAVFNTKTNIK